MAFLLEIVPRCVKHLRDKKSKNRMVCRIKLLEPEFTLAQKSKIFIPNNCFEIILASKPVKMVFNVCNVIET